MAMSTGQGTVKVKVPCSAKTIFYIGGGGSRSPISPSKTTTMVTKDFSREGGADINWPNIFARKSDF